MDQEIRLKSHFLDPFITHSPPRHRERSEDGFLMTFTINNKRQSTWKH